MKTILSILTAATLTIKLSAADTNAASKASGSVPLKISAVDATNYYDQTMIVTGKVVQVTIRPSVTFLNLDKPFPNSPFAVVIIHGKTSFYGDANALKGKSIEIRGKIQNYKDKPEIVLNTTNQLTVLNFTNSISQPFASAIPAPAVAPKDTPSTNDIPEIL
jgi:DNA/RNA endonuclease YhcR with UshA esterase domain